MLETELECTRLGQREFGGFIPALKKLSCFKFQELVAWSSELVDSKLGQSELWVRRAKRDRLRRRDLGGSIL